MHNVDAIAIERQARALRAAYMRDAMISLAARLRRAIPARTRAAHG